MKSGYVITSEGNGALDLFDSNPGVRFAAALDDGRGFAAYDVPDLAEVAALGRYGEILAAVEPIPDYPPSWPRPDGPKRHITVGDERFVLYDVDALRTSAVNALSTVDHYAPRALAVVATDPGTFFVLVETGPEWDCPLPFVWDATVTVTADKRLVNPMTGATVDA